MHRIIIFFLTFIFPENLIYDYLPKTKNANERNREEIIDFITFDNILNNKIKEVI